jgi:hypothetical protein
MRRLIAALVLTGVTVALAGPVSAQEPLQLRARLAPVPIDLAMQSTIAGSGAVTATRRGPTLSVTGSFAGLKSPATVARLHVAAKGIRGPAVFDLTVSGGTSGTVSGTFELTPQRIADASAGRFYVQIHSEGAPEGNLWGWLLPQAKRR